MRLAILGGGLAAISLAYFLQERKDISEICILEKEERVGGLCRSFAVNGATYDIGPHIIFSKNKAILQLMLDVLGDNKQQLRRSNQIIHKKCFVQYPFENDLSKLPQADLDYCVNSFLHNPYTDYAVTNMLQFFLKNFGEGITNLYLRPYNEKIWKFDPGFMDTQMVERIPKPPQEDILNSAQGKTIDGYLHQLYFWYPKTQGIQGLINGFVDKFNHKVKVQINQKVRRLSKNANGFLVETDKNHFTATQIVSTIPVNLLCNAYAYSPVAIKSQAARLCHNSLIVAMLNVKIDRAGNNFGFMVADRKIIFHRFAKLDFLGDAYHQEGTTYLFEITYRQGDLVDQMSDNLILEKIITGFIDLGFIDSAQDINFFELKRFEHAYVIYDLEHRRNMEYIKKYFNHEHIFLHGRFGEFEYLNMDSVIERSKDLARSIVRK